MHDVLRAFGLAIAGMFHPRILWLSIRPLCIALILWAGIFWLTWDSLQDFFNRLILDSVFSTWIVHLMGQLGLEEVRAVMTPFLMAVFLMPLLIVSILLLVTLTTLNDIVKQVSRQKKYLHLSILHGGNFWGGLVFTMTSSLLCLMLIVLTLPAWWIPPIFAIIPPLLYGWLTMRLMSYDVLALHASQDERIALMQQHRKRLLFMGIMVGLMGAVPSLVWLFSIFLFVLFPFFTFLLVWGYALIFIFATLWFTHYLLQALNQMRHKHGATYEHTIDQ